MARVRFNYADIKPINLGNKKEVKQFIEQLFSDEGRYVQLLDYIFCSDSYLLEINKTFLDHDYYTDIITFDLSNSTDAIIGEIYISIDRVKDNAISHGSAFSEELLRVIFHGALHLIGYKDKKKSEITIMRDKEDYYLRLFGAK